MKTLFSLKNTYKLLKSPTSRGGHMVNLFSLKNTYKLLKSLVKSPPPPPLPRLGEDTGGEDTGGGDTGGGDKGCGWILPKGYERRTGPQTVTRFAGSAFYFCTFDFSNFIYFVCYVFKCGSCGAR